MKMRCRMSFFFLITTRHFITHFPRETRNGRRAAVLISAEELESLEDTLELLSDPEAMAELRESAQALAAGDVVSGDELRANYLKK